MKTKHEDQHTKAPYSDVHTIFQIKVTALKSKTDVKHKESLKEALKTPFTIHIQNLDGAHIWLNIK